MQANPSQTETIEPTVDDLDSLVDAALEKGQAETTQASAESGISARAAAAAEEQLAAQRIAAANAEDQPPRHVPSPVTEEPEDLASIASRGRDYLMERMRKHAEAQAKKPAYVPPPPSASMMEKINEEMEAGRRTLEKHAAQRQYAVDAQARASEAEKRAQGSSTPQQVAGDVVPDPKAFGDKQFAGRPPTFSPNA